MKMKTFGKGKSWFKCRLRFSKSLCEVSLPRKRANFFWKKQPSMLPGNCYTEKQYQLYGINVWLSILISEKSISIKKIYPMQHTSYTERGLEGVSANPSIPVNDHTLLQYTTVHSVIVCGHVFLMSTQQLEAIDSNSLWHYALTSDEFLHLHGHE